MREAIGIVLTDIKEGKNIDVYVTTLLRLVLGGAQAASLTSESVGIAVALAALAVISIQMLRCRQAVTELEQTTGHEFCLGPWDNAVFVSEMPGATQICVLATSPDGFMTTHAERLKAFARSGGTLKVVMIDPNCKQTLAFTGRQLLGAESDPDVLQARIWLCARRLREIAAEAGAGGGVELRVTEGMPSAVVTIVESEAGVGTVLLTPHGFHQAYVARPSYRFSSDAHPPIFRFHKQQFAQIWDWEGTRRVPSS